MRKYFCVALFAILLLIGAAGYPAIAATGRDSVSPDRSAGQGTCSTDKSGGITAGDILHYKKATSTGGKGYKVGASQSTCCSDKTTKCLYDCGKARTDEMACMKKCGQAYSSTCHCIYAWGSNSVANPSINIDKARRDCC